LLSITPDQAPVALFTASGFQGGAPTIFDATLSQSPTGSIQTYAWDFGDGHTLNTSNPITSHTYTTGGVFTVTLTVTNSAGTSTQQVFTGAVVSRQGGPSAQFSENITIAAPIPPIPPTPPSPGQPLPPSHFRYKVIKKKCGDDEHKCCFKYTHVLKWNPSPDPTVIAYQIVRNGRLRFTIPANGPFVVIDKRGKKN